MQCLFSDPVSHIMVWSLGEGVRSKWQDFRWCAHWGKYHLCCRTRLENEAQYSISQIYLHIILGMQVGTLKEITKEIYSLWECLWIVICDVQQCPYSSFLGNKVFWGFSASIKLGYTSDDPTRYWKRNIHLREIYCSLECDTKVISVEEIGRHEKSLQQALEPIQRQCISVLWPHCLFSLVWCSPPRLQSGELLWQGNKLLLHLAESLPIKIRLKDTAVSAGQYKRFPEGKMLLLFVIKEKKVRHLAKNFVIAC